MRFVEVIYQFSSRRGPSIEVGDIDTDEWERTIAYPYKRKGCPENCLNRIVVLSSWRLLDHEYLDQ